MMRIVLATACIAVLLAPANSWGDVTLFEVQPFFESAAAGNGNFLAGFEDFENNNLDAGQGVLLPPDGTLQFGQPLVGADGLGLPNGLSTPLVTVEALGDDINTTWALQDDGNNDAFLVFGFGIEITLTEPVTAFGLEYREFIPGDEISVEVLDGNGDIAFSGLFSESASFLGFVADPGETISFIRIGDADTILIPDVDDFQVWQAVPEPGAFVGIVTVSLFGIGRRSRRS